MACTQVYVGPWVPGSGLKGEVAVSGMVKGEDAVTIRIRDTKEEEPDTLISVDEDMEMTVDLKMSTVRAERTKSSGSEVFVWLQ